MKLIELGMTVALERADFGARYWRSMKQYAVSERETEILEAAAICEDSVIEAVNGYRAHSPARVLNAGEVATNQLHGLELAKAKATEYDGASHELGQAILRGEECCALIAEILGLVEGRATPAEGHHV